MASLRLLPVEEYITVAKEKYGYNGEQALGMLFWHKHDLERAVLDLANFTPFPDEWTVEDKVLFEQAFQFHGKSFHRIRQMVCVSVVTVSWPLYLITPNLTSPSAATGQIDCQPGQILLLVEEDAQSNQRDGPPGEDEEKRQFGKRKRPREQRGLG